MSKLVFFTADDGIHGREVWATDGTPEGTRLVKNIQTLENAAFKTDPYWLSSFPGNFAVLPDGRLVFDASDRTFRRTELWVSDGTEDGTFVLKDIGGEHDSGAPRGMTPLGDGRIVFSAIAGRDMPFEETGRELWITDGTDAGTTLLKDIRPGVDEWDTPFNSNPESFVGLRNGKVIFTADDGIHGREPWVTDGTDAGTILLRDLNPGPGNSSAQFSFSTVLPEDGRLVFDVAYDAGGGWVNEQWVTDGTPEGTQPYEPGPAPEPVMPPGPFERGIGEEPFPIRPSLNYASLNETQTVYSAQGARTVGPDDLVGLELTPRLVPEGGSIVITPLSEAGAYVLARFSGSDGSIVQGTNFNNDGRGGFGLSAAAHSALGDGAVTITAVSPAVFVTNDEHATIKITYAGGEGTITQNFFSYNPGARWFNPSTETMGLLGEGEISVVSVIGEKRESFGGPLVSFDLPYRVADVSAIIPIGTEPWITDGTEDGTRLLADINPGAYGSAARVLPHQAGGKVLFTAVDGAPSPDDLGAAGLWTTDGTSAGTIKLASAPGDLSTPQDHIIAHATGDGHVLFSLSRGELWVTDGTPAGTSRVHEGIARVAAAADLGDGRVLLATEGSDSLPSALLVTDGTADGTVLIARDMGMPMMFRSTLLDRDTLIASYQDPELGMEPFAFDLANGGVTLLGDIHPGAETSRPENFILALPEALRKPVSTLFDTRVTLLDAAEDGFALDPYFTDPQGGPLAYTVSGLPSGVTWNPGAGQITAAPDATPGRHEVTVTAASSLGGAATDSFAWDLVDTGLLRLDTTGAWGRETRDSPITLEAGSALHIGHKGGDARLLRIEDAEAVIDDGVLSVAGKLFSEQFATDLPLMEGGFSIDMASLAVTEFTDDGVEGSHSLVGGLIEMAFSDIVIAPEGITLRTDLGFDGVLEALNTSGGLLALSIDGDGPSFGLSALGTGRWFSDDALALPLPEGAPFGLEFSDLGIDYDLITDSAWFSGKAELTWGETVAKEYSFLSDSTTSKLTLDLAGDQDDPDSFFARGDKFLRIGRDGDGWTWDVVGEITYEGQEGGTPAPGRPSIEEMGFSLDTVEKAFGGNFKGTLPFLFKGLTLEAEIGAGWDPLAIDSFAFGIDGLNKPLGTTGIFVQGGKLAAEGLAAQDPDDWPVLSADILMSLGPTPLSPLRGHIGGKIEGARVTLEMEAKTEVGYLLPGAVERIAAPMIRWLGVDADEVVEFALLNVNGSVAVDFARPTLSASVGANFLGDVITGQANFTTQMLSDEVILVNASVGASATFPEAIPLIGGLSRAGNGLAVFTSDGDNSNDFAAAWTKFSVPFYGDVSAGLRFWLDGRYERLGTDSIDAIGSWPLGPAQELVILSAQWDTPTDDARLELIAPDGTVLTEADFGTDTGLADAIALVDDLGSPTGRHVALQAPVAGVWDLRLADETGRGDVRYDASEILQGPQATITDVSIDPGTRSGVIGLDLDAGDAAQVALSIFVSDSPDALSGLQVIDAIVPANDAGALSFDWDFAALASGVWWLHARTEADAMVPVVDMFATPIEVTGAADLAVTLEQEAAAGGASVLTVTVANDGDIASGAGRLELTAPEAVLNAPALPGADPLTRAMSEIALPDLAPGESLRFDFALPSGLEVMTRPVMADVSSAVFDGDMDNNMAMLFLTPMQTDLTGTITTRGGTVLAGAGVTATLPDGSSIDALSDALGTFTLAGLTPGAGHVDAALDHTRGAPPLTAVDALDILRMAVGLTPSFGAPGPMDFIAADVNQDGRITALDALEVLRAAVGLESATGPQWVFVDSRTDLPGMTRDTVTYDTGLNLATHPAETPLDMTAILLGNMTDPM